MSLAAVLLAVCAFFFFHPIFLENKTITVELGDDFDASENISSVVFGSLDHVVIEDNVDTSSTGEYTVTYKLRTYKCTAAVSVVDTTAPELTLNDSVTKFVTDDITPEDFVSSAFDLAGYTLSLSEDQDFTEAGTYTVTVTAEDPSGNRTSKEAALIVEADTQPPVISGISDIVLTQGSSADLSSGVTATDDHDEAPSLSVDSSQVNFNVPGTYTVTYTATDKFGNTSTATRTVTVKAKPTSSSETEAKIVYLTFDDGPAENMGKVMDILDRYGIKATFFVTGAGSSYRSLITRAYNEGHTIGLHSYSHDYSKIYASEDAFFADLQQVSDMVESLTGHKSYILRFPGGSSNAVSKKYCAGIMTALTADVEAKGYVYFDWNVSSGDASGNNVPASEIVANSTASSADRINILMHCTDAKDTTVEALPQIIEYYMAKGYVFKPLTEQSTATHHHVNN